MDECGLDALCDLLDDDSNGDALVVDESNTISTGTSSVCDLEDKMIKMQEEMKLLQQKIQAKKQTNNCVSTPPKPANASKLKDLETNIFDRPSAEDAAVCKETKSIAIVDFNEEVNPYIETPELTESGMQIQNILNRSKVDPDKGVRSKPKSGPSLQLPGKCKDDVVELDPYSGIRILNPLVSSAKMKERMAGRKMIRLSGIQSRMQGCESKDDWVTIGVVVNKSETKTSKNGKNFSIWKLCDLNDCNVIVSFFLFGEVYQKHWKTSVGSVIGLLNPSIMDGKDSKSDLAITIDSHYKVMHIGKSQDFGHCKAKKKDGYPCTMVINKQKCEYCQFHVKSAYNKLSSKRVDLQTSYSGVEPRGLKSKLLSKQQIMYGGQSFSEQPRSVGTSKKLKQKDKLRLDGLGMQTKVNQVISEETSQIGHSGSGSDSARKQTKENVGSPKTFQDYLNVPSPGSRNLLRHLSHESEKKQIQAGTFKSISAKDLLKMHQSQLTNKNLEKKTSLESMPKLGAGFKPGQHVDLNLNALSTNLMPMNRAELAKLRAIRKIRENGKFEKDDPNAVRSSNKSEKAQNSVIKRVQQCLESDTDSDSSTPAKRSRLEREKNAPHVDIDKIMNLKSSHENEANQEQMERMDQYFGVLETKEKMEDKMMSTKEVTVDVVSCKRCNYTAYHQSDMCREQTHQVKRHKATKRFFKCLDCKQRTTSLNRIPTKACRNCGGSNFERIGMWEERGPKDSEKLFIRDEDSLKSWNSK